MPSAGEGGAGTMDRVLAFLRRYQPFIVTVTIITLIGFLLPGSSEKADQTTGPGTTTDIGSLEGDSTDQGSAAGSDATRRVGTGGATNVAAGPPLTFEEAKKQGVNVDFGPNCDTSTGRIKVPSRYAPPCVVPHSGPNGGKSKGVSEKEIVVVVYRGQPDPVADSIVQAAGANDSAEDVEATFKDWKAYFEGHYSTYNRKVRLVFLRGSGDALDDVASRADARAVDLEHHAFAVWAHLGAPAAFVDELSARGIIWITGETRPTDFYLKRAPYGWGVQMNLDQGFVHASEYIGKRLWGKKARWAGSADLQLKTRKFGLIYADEGDNANKPAKEFFTSELKKYGASLTDAVAISNDTATSQEQAGPLIQRLMDKGVTTVMFTGSPLTPVFLTQEATEQRWFPEWLSLGGNLVDTTFFGRTYNQAQWAHAFGLSQLWVRPARENTEVWYQHEWQHCRDAEAVAESEIIYQPELIFYTGVHLAGPVLTPQAFADALFSYPPPPVGISSVHRSFGKHGLWPFLDFGTFDDTTEIWWDANAIGNDEISKPGKGMYRYVNGGKRYLPGSWPRTEPQVIDNDHASVTQVDDLPPQDRFPRYEDKHCT